MSAARVALMLAMCTAVMSYEDGWKEVCVTHCRSDGDPMIHNMRIDSCEGYKHMLPKPRVYNICADAFNKILKKTCATVCVGGSHSASKMEQLASQYCKPFKRKLPKPASFDCCMEGAIQGSAAGKKYVEFLKNDYARKLAEEPEETKADIVKEMILEADIEANQLANMDPDAKVVVEEIRAEAEAEVKEIKQEIKAGKTDLDLAREAARAAFKAKQEADAQEAAAEGATEAVEEIDL